jgi:hypothetical protein
MASRPAGSNASLSSTTVIAPTFLADVPGTYSFSLVVNDGALNSDPDTVEIHTNGPPVANAGSDQIVPLGAVVQLDGSGSSDPENSALIYQWILNTRPAGSAAQLSDVSISNPTFIADLAGAYIAQLVVNDGLVNSESDIVQIATENRLPVANAGPDQSNIALNPTTISCRLRGASSRGRPAARLSCSMRTPCRLRSRPTGLAATESF